jgi:hypothetical protein
LITDSKIKVYHCVNVLLDQMSHICSYALNEGPVRIK